MPKDEARHALEFDDLYIIRPPTHMWNYDESPTYEGVTGRAVKEDFEYASDTNDRWISGGELRALVS
jgi:UDP-N-acetylglucosamine 4,6-dehydratase